MLLVVTNYRQIFSKNQGEISKKVRYLWLSSVDAIKIEAISRDINVLTL